MALLPPKPEVTREGMDGLAPRIDPDAFAGVPTELLAAALCAEGIPVQRPYDTVYRSPLWIAGTRGRKFEEGASVAVRLGLNAHCPVAERVSREGLVILHHVFLGGAADMADLVAGLEKVQQHASELRFDALKKKARSAARTLLRKVGVNA